MSDYFLKYMAKLYPERLPESVLNNPKRSAEKKVFEALSALPSSFVVFYSVGWQVRDSKSGARDGEADFVIAHPDLGLMILEVKGGRVRYDASLQQWFTKDRDELEHEIKDPVEQARNSKGALLAKLKELPSWEPHFLSIAYLAVFPDVVAEQTHLRPDLPRQIVLDSVDLRNIELKVREGFSWYTGTESASGALGINRLRLVENFFGQSFALRTPLGAELEREEQRIIELTENQFGILQFIQKHRQALIEGCAGSGKTMLAMEKARRLSEQGFDTLLLCFNALLAASLRQHVPNGVEVFHFHELCKFWAKEAGLGYRSSRNEEEFYDKILPEMLLDAISELGPQYDAIIVDEGQDFRGEWWDALFFLLRDSKDGIFYVFYDSNQNIYRRSSKLAQLISTEPFTMWENCRNTRSIHYVVKEFHHEPTMVFCRGSEGHKPELSYFSTPHEQEDLVKKIIHRLVVEEKIEPSQIVLLTTRKPDKTQFCPGKKMGNFILMEWGEPRLRKTDIRVSSVHGFKGLESRIIILTGLEDNDTAWLNGLLYVACSRARTYLIVLAHERSRNQIAGIFQPGGGDQ